MNKFKILFTVLTVVLAGCALDTQYVGSDAKTNDLPYTFSQFSDVPIPENASMNLDKTAIFGRENEWIGKITFSAPYNVGGVFDFYMSEMPKFGWKEITSARGANSVLTYTRDSRVALIQLSPSFQGTTIILTMSPAPKEKKTVVKTAFKPVSVERSVINSQPKQDFEQTKNPQLVEGNVETMPLVQSSLFVSPDAKKAMAGSLGLGDASNVNYKSNSNGVGQPPRF